MNLGTFVVLIILIAIVGAIIWSWVKTHRAGRHIGCDDCGGECACGPSGSCHAADQMVRDMDDALHKAEHR